MKCDWFIEKSVYSFFLCWQFQKSQQLFLVEEKTLHFFIPEDKLYENWFLWLEMANSVSKVAINDDSNGAFYSYFVAFSDFLKANKLHFRHKFKTSRLLPDFSNAFLARRNNEYMWKTKNHKVDISAGAGAGAFDKVQVAFASWLTDSTDSVNSQLQPPPRRWTARAHTFSISQAALRKPF